MNGCDLHTHSLFSDGTYSPQQIVAEAGRLGLAVALTDHNTIEGLPSFMEEGARRGVCVVPGIEITTDYADTELHLLGYGIAPEQYDTIGFAMKEQRLLKELSNMELVEKLGEAGYVIDYAAVKKRSAGDNINRAHIAAELVEKGCVASIDEAFRTLLSEEYGLYRPVKHMALFDAIALLRQVGAVPVLAHPLKDLEEAALRELLPLAREAGLLGLEVYYSTFTAAQRETAAQMADEFGLLKTGGSDFHGSNKPRIGLGVGCGDLRVSAAVYRELLAVMEKGG